MTKATPTRPPWLTLADPAPSAPDTVSRPIAALVINACMVISALPVMLLLAPGSSWEPGVLLTLLIGLSLATRGFRVYVRRGLAVDASSAVAMTGLFLLGPLPAVVIFCVPDISEMACGESRWVACLGNLGSAAWASAVGAWLLEGAANGAGSSSLLVLAGAALAFCLFNSALVLPTPVLLDGAAPISVLRISQRSAPLLALNAVLATLVSILYTTGHEAVALAVLTLAVAAPRVGLPSILHLQSVSELPSPVLAGQYSVALAERLNLTRHQRRLLRGAAGQLAHGRPSLEDLSDFTPMMTAVLHAGERWDGGEGSFPGVARGAEIPIESRVLAVADTWAALTAKDTRKLSPLQAVSVLESRAGAEFDPEVVRAAAQITEDEILGTSPRTQPGLVPRLVLR